MPAGKIVLSPGLVQNYCGCVRKIQTAIPRLHRNSHNLRHRQVTQYVGGESPSLGAKQYRLAFRVIVFGVNRSPAGRNRDETRMTETVETGRKRVMFDHAGIFMIIETRATHAFIVQLKA